MSAITAITDLAAFDLTSYLPRAALVKCPHVWSGVPYLIPLSDFDQNKKALLSRDKTSPLKERTRMKHPTMPLHSLTSQYRRGIIDLLLT